MAADVTTLAHDDDLISSAYTPGPRGHRLGRAPDRGRDPPGAGRPAGSLKLIASENYASPAVLLTMGTWFSDKYAEGTVGHRFYAGCQNVDTVESLAAEHARELFGAPYAYVQPHSGIDANLVAFWSILAHRVETPGAGEGSAPRTSTSSATRTGRRCATSSATSACSACRSTPAATSPTASAPTSAARCSTSSSTAPTPRPGCSTTTPCAAKAREFKPLVLVAGYSAYPRRVNFAKMREIADEVGATLMVDMAHFAGLVAGKVFTGDEDPVPHAHITTTTTHKSLRGPRGGLVLAQEEYAADVDRGCPMVLGGPLSHVMAAKAVALAEARQPSFQTYAQNVADNAKSLAEGFLTRAARSSSPAAPTTTSCCSTSRRSASPAARPSRRCSTPASSPTATRCPSDPNGAWYTSGIRLGTPALTTRGFGHDEFDNVAELIVHVLPNTQPGTTKAGGRRRRRTSSPTAWPTRSRTPRPRCSTSTRSTRVSSSTLTRQPPAVLHLGTAAAAVPRAAARPGRRRRGARGSGGR